MTVQKDEAELAKAQMVKVMRSMIRLKHTLAADRELNEALPRAEADFDTALHRGMLPAAIDVEAIAKAAVPK